MLSSLVTADEALRSLITDHGKAIAPLVEKAAAFLCNDIESAEYQHDAAELTVFLAGLESYLRAARYGTEGFRRKVHVIRTQLLVRLEGLTAALTSPLALTRVRLAAIDQPRHDDPKRADRLKDGGFDVFLHGPIISSFLASENPAHNAFAWSALARVVSKIQRDLESGRLLSTHWLCSVLHAVPVTISARQSREEQRENHRYVSLPTNRATFLVMSDTQFGKDSTVHRPLRVEGEDGEEMIPFECSLLVKDAATKLRRTRDTNDEWSGLLHLGDVVCNGDYKTAGRQAQAELEHSAAALGVAVQNIVMIPGNHDDDRSALIDWLRRQPRTGRGRTWKIENVVDEVRRAAFARMLHATGLIPFQDTYSRLVGRRITPSNHGIEFVSFLAPRINIHMIGLWPVARYHLVEASGKRKTEKEFGIHLSARFEVREFLERTSPRDIVILMCHHPLEELKAWGTGDKDKDDWIGAESAVNAATFGQYVTALPATGPSIHLVLSGHTHKKPRISSHACLLNYVAGAFHLKSGLACAGSYAARLTVEEGVIRIDDVVLDAKQLGKPATSRRAPSILAVGGGALLSHDGRCEVVDTYDTAADEFIAKTASSGKYVELEEVRAAFLRQLKQCFPDKMTIRILDVGAGAGRDTRFFLDNGCQVHALEGAPRLVEHLRKTEKATDALTVEAVNLLDRDQLERALRDRSFHGVWMCATLVHVPQADDLSESPSSSMLVDEAVVRALATTLEGDGVFYLDSKLGQGAHVKERGNVYSGRWFRYRDLARLRALFEGAGLVPTEGGWYDGNNGIDAWIWHFAVARVPTSGFV